MNQYSTSAPHHAALRPLVAAIALLACAERAVPAVLAESPNLRGIIPLLATVGPGPENRPGSVSDRAPLLIAGTDGFVHVGDNRAVGRIPHDDYAQLGIRLSALLAAQPQSIDRLQVAVHRSLPLHTVVGLLGAVSSAVETFSLLAGVGSGSGARARVALNIRRATGVRHLPALLSADRSHQSECDLLGRWLPMTTRSIGRAPSWLRISPNRIRGLRPPLAEFPTVLDITPDNTDALMTWVEHDVGPLVLCFDANLSHGALVQYLNAIAYACVDYERKRPNGAVEIIPCARTFERRLDIWVGVSRREGLDASDAKNPFRQPATGRGPIKGDPFRIDVRNEGLSSLLGGRMLASQGPLGRLDGTLEAPDSCAATATRVSPDTPGSLSSFVLGGKLPPGVVKNYGRIRLGSNKTNSAIVDVGVSSWHGPCHRGDITEVVRRRAGAFGACYESEPGSATGTDRKFGLRLRIDARGTVSLAEVIRDSVVDDTRTANCVIRVARRMRFPVSAAPCTAEVPLQFDVVLGEGGGTPTPHQGGHE